LDCLDRGSICAHYRESFEVPGFLDGRTVIFIFPVLDQHPERFFQFGQNFRNLFDVNLWELLKDRVQEVVPVQLQLADIKNVAIWAVSGIFHRPKAFVDLLEDVADCSNSD